MAYHILRKCIPSMRVTLVYGSSAPLDNILYHENFPIIIQSLDSNCYLSLIYSLIAHSITLAHPKQSYKQTTRRSMDDNEVHPKRPGMGDRKCGYSKQRNEATDSPTSRCEVQTPCVESQTLMLSTIGVHLRTPVGLIQSNRVPSCRPLASY